jgi:uncharacterized protein YajQ (UPF0234 family)
MMKDTKRKVLAQMMGDQIRVSGKDKDDLQAVNAMLRNANLPNALQFIPKSLTLKTPTRIFSG